MCFSAVHLYFLQQSTVINTDKPSLHDPCRLKKRQTEIQIYNKRGICNRIFMYHCGFFLNYSRIESKVDRSKICLFMPAFCVNPDLEKDVQCILGFLAVHCISLLHLSVLYCTYPISCSRRNCMWHFLLQLPVWRGFVSLFSLWTHLDQLPQPPQYGSLIIWREGEREIPITLALQIL